MIKEERGDIGFIKVPTMNLKILVDHYRKVLPEQQFRELIDDIKSVHEKVTKILLSYQPGPQRARAAHLLLNEQLERAAQDPSAEKNTCQKGCSACCHMEIEISQDEAQLLAQVVREGQAIDRERLDEQANRSRKDPEWAKLLQESNRCIFLGTNGACKIYDSRPLVCRKHLVTSAKSECLKNDGKPLPVLAPLAELVVSATLSLPGNTHSTLAKGLREVLRPDSDEATGPRIASL